MDQNKTTCVWFVFGVCFFGLLCFLGGRAEVEQLHPLPTFQVGHPTAELGALMTKKTAVFASPSLRVGFCGNLPQGAIRLGCNPQNRDLPWLLWVITRPDH